MMTGWTEYMNKFFKKHIKKIAVVLMSVVVATSLPGQSYALTYADITSDAIKDKEDKITSAEAEREALEKSLAELEKKRRRWKKIKRILANMLKNWMRSWLKLKHKSNN